VFQINRTYAAFATLTIVLGAWYMFNLYRQIMEGPTIEAVDKKTESIGVRDLSAREAIALVPIVILIFVLGIFPNLVFNRTEPSASMLVDDSQSASMTVMEPPDAAEDAGS